MLLIQNGRVLDPWTGTDAQLDVLIGNDGVIAKIAEKIDAPADCKIFDAAGLTVSPGFVDGHVHFRDPGQTQKEDVLTGAAAALAVLLAGCAGGIFAPAADLGSEPLLCALLGLAVTGLTVLPAMAGTPKPTKTE